MTNVDLTNFANQILLWDTRMAIRKKNDCWLCHRIWNKTEHSVWCQLEISIARPTLSTIYKQK